MDFDHSQYDYEHPISFFQRLTSTRPWLRWILTQFGAPRDFDRCSKILNGGCLGLINGGFNGKIHGGFNGEIYIYISIGFVNGFVKHVISYFQ